MFGFTAFLKKPIPQDELGRADFLAGKPRQLGTTWAYFHGYFGALAEEVQRLKEIELRKSDGSS